jgi:uncharacterized RDD family membrane protein YckC
VLDVAGFLTLSFGISLLGFFLGNKTSSPAFVMLLCAQLLLDFVFVLKDGFNGYSVGKYLCNLRVVDVKTGLPCDFGASLKRNLPLLIPLYFLLAAFQIGRGRRWGEKWADTKVVWQKFHNNSVLGITNAKNPDLYKSLNNKATRVFLAIVLCLAGFIGMCGSIYIKSETDRVRCLELKQSQYEAPLPILNEPIAKPNDRN